MPQRAMVVFSAQWAFSIFELNTCTFTTVRMTNSMDTSLSREAKTLRTNISPACIPTLQHHNSYNRIENHRQWNAVWPPDDGRKDARNMSWNNWLTMKSLIVASSWSRLYLLIKDARSFEHKVICVNLTKKKEDAHFSPSK